MCIRDSSGRVDAVCNGVDAEFFSPEHPMVLPYHSAGIALLLTGAMDYWPSIDAVSWVAGNSFPQLLKDRPGMRFYSVGRSSAPAVLALASDHITVTGTVDDVRPYLQHAAVVVAPLRLARGIQNLSLIHI